MAKLSCQTLSSEKILALEWERGQTAPSARGWLRVPQEYWYGGGCWIREWHGSSSQSFLRRKALEMGCCIESSLAKILAEFEITLERDVLQPLSKLSEVGLDALLTLFSHPITPSHIPKPSPLTLCPLSPGGASHHPEAQEDPPEADF